MVRTSSTDHRLDSLPRSPGRWLGTESSFGSSVSTAGDVNGDGYADVIVGASGYDNGETNEGRASVYHGSSSGLSASPSWTTESNQVSANFGRSVSTAGDVNGDGYADVIIGADGYDNGESDEGRAFVYHGSAAGLFTSPSWTAESDQAGALFGYSVSTAGDVNGDGYADVIVGAFTYDNGQNNEGGAFVYMGNGGTGIPVLPRQLRANGTPIGHLGLATGGAFSTSATGRSPFGRVMVALETEVKPLGVPFDGTGTEMTSFQDSTVAGVELLSPVSGLSVFTAYHWRARLRYDSVSSPFQAASRWFGPHADSAEDADLRTIPCVNTAQAIAYGGGKAGTAGVPVLSSSSPPALGTSSDLTVTNVVPGVNLTILFFGLSSANAAFDGGTLRVNPLSVSVFVAPFDASGKFVLPIDLPNDPQLCGLDLFFQFMIQDPGAAGFYHTAQTNGMMWTLGS